MNYCYCSYSESAYNYGNINKELICIFITNITKMHIYIYCTLLEAVDMLYMVLI